MDPNPKLALVARAQQSPSIEFSEAFKEEMAMTAETFQVELTELQVLGYLRALEDLKPQEIRRGFARARKMLRMFPRPADLREQADLAGEEDGSSKRYYIPEPPPFRTKAEQEEEQKTWQALVKQFGWEEKPPELSAEEIEKRKKMGLEAYTRYLIGG